MFHPPLVPSPLDIRRPIEQRDKRSFGWQAWDFTAILFTDPSRYGMVSCPAG
jgi:hypothetical protein